MTCPSCGSANMIFGGHHGMEHNVCESCGTVIECDQLTDDICQKGFRELPYNYESRTTAYGAATYRVQHRKSGVYQDGLESINHLMDGLNLPSTVRRTATDFFRYSSHLNKTASVGACVYLAMKDFNMPITIRYIANYLQVSHFAIGRVMRKLEKRLENRKPGTLHFGVDELAPLIFKQAQFGFGEDGKKMFNLFLEKTIQLISLLQECQATTGYEPHLIILAAGYVVWKSLYLQRWTELDLDHNQVLGRSYKSFQMSSYLSEIGIQISNLGSLTPKVTLITDLLQKLAYQIPWLSIKKLSKDEVLVYLNYFLKYKSQIIEMTAQEMAKEKKITAGKVESEVKEEVIEVKEEDRVDSFIASEEPLNSCSLIPTSALLIDNLSEYNDQNRSNAPSSLMEGLQESTTDSKSKEDSSGSKPLKVSLGKMRFIKVKDMLKLAMMKDCNALNKSLAQNVSVPDVNTCTKDKIDAKKGKKKPATIAVAKSNGYNQLLKVTHPQISQRRKKGKAELLHCVSDRENPDLLFP